MLHCIHDQKYETIYKNAVVMWIGMILLYWFQWIIFWGTGPPQLWCFRIRSLTMMCWWELICTWYEQSKWSLFSAPWQCLLTCSPRYGPPKQLRAQKHCNMFAMTSALTCLSTSPWRYHLPCVLCLGSTSETSDAVVVLSSLHSGHQWTRFAMVLETPRCTPHARIPLHNSLTP